MYLKYEEDLAKIICVGQKLEDRWEILLGSKITWLSAPNMSGVENDDIKTLWRCN